MSEGPTHYHLAVDALLLPREPQTYRYLVVVDFEATCELDKSTQEPQEVIEFPAVLVDTTAPLFQVVDTFQRHCRPTLRPKLSSFCTELTGITQDTVDKSSTFPQVYNEFLAWLVSHGLSPSNPESAESRDHRYILVTHGDWDLKEMLPKQLGYHATDGTAPVPALATCFQKWINLNTVFQKAFNVPPSQLPRGNGGIDALSKYFRLTLAGRLHCGLDDSVNIAELAVHMMHLGVRFEPVAAVCFRCGKPGHMSRDCTETSDARGTALAPASAAPAMRPGDWLCPQCKAHNFARRLDCFKCNRRRPT